MATDITKTGSVVIVSDGTNPKQQFVRPTNIAYSFNAAGDTISINFGGYRNYDIPLADLRIQGAGSAPADAAAALTALTTSVFP